MNNLLKGYEIARLISYNAIKEGTYLQQYIDGEECKTDGIYVTHNKSIYSLKLFIDEYGLEVLPYEEVGISILCDEGMEFKIIEDELEKPIFRRDTKLKDEFINKCNNTVKKEKIYYCEQCGIPFLDEKIREKFHGCCSSECEKEKINKNNKFTLIIDDKTLTFSDKKEARKYLIDELNEIERISVVSKEYIDGYAKSFNLNLEYEHISLDFLYQEYKQKILKILETI